MKLWWDYCSPDGYGYSWGRSLGAISYMDTMEIVGFSACIRNFGQYRFNSLRRSYNAAWTWLGETTSIKTAFAVHLYVRQGRLRYITKEREWQQTTTFSRKIMAAHKNVHAGDAMSRSSSFRLRPTLRQSRAFEFFSGWTGAQVWSLVGSPGCIQFALPFCDGTEGWRSLTYEPMPA